MQLEDQSIGMNKKKTLYKHLQSSNIHPSFTWSVLSTIWPQDSNDIWCIGFVWWYIEGFTIWRKQPPQWLNKVEWLSQYKWDPVSRVPYHQLTTACTDIVGSDCLYPFILKPRVKIPTINCYSNAPPNVSKSDCTAFGLLTQQQQLSNDSNLVHIYKTAGWLGMNIKMNRW